MSDGDMIGVHMGPALTRWSCNTCGVETLFRGVHCIHCGKSRTRFTIKAEKKKDWTVSRRQPAPSAEQCS